MVMSKVNRKTEFCNTGMRIDLFKADVEMPPFGRFGLVNTRQKGHSHTFDFDTLALKGAKFASARGSATHS